MIPDVCQTVPVWLYYFSATALGLLTGWILYRWLRHAQ